MASVKCEQCSCRIGAWSFRKKAYIMEETNGYRHYFCSPVCCDLWCNVRAKEGMTVTRKTPSGVGEWRAECPDNGESIPTSRFICPGCGERATAKDASLCPSCGHFVHHSCVRHGFIAWYCPICNTGLVGQT